MPKISEAKKKLNEELAKRAVNMHINGMIIKDIAKVLERSYGWVWKVLRDNK